MAGNVAAKVRVKCPFYLSDQQRGAVIRCEGIQRYTSIAFRFMDLDAMRSYRENVCADTEAWQRCPYAQAIFNTELTV